MKKPIFSILKEKEILVISSYLLISILYYLYNTKDFLLYDFSNLFISQATLDGVSVSARIQFFYTSVLGSLVLFPLIYFFLNKLKSYFHIQKKYLQVPTVFAITGVFLMLSDLFGLESKISIQYTFVIFLLSIFILGFSKSKNDLRFLSNSFVFSAILNISFILFTAVFFLFNSDERVIEYRLLYFLLVLLLVSFLFVMVKKYSQLSLRKIFTFSLALSLIPVFIFISIETFFYFRTKQDIYINYKLLFGGLLTTSILLFIFYNKVKQIKPSTSKLFNYVFAPSALLSFLLLILYTPILEQSHDLFELANPANTQMNVFVFHQIPFVDFMSSHMFSEQFYGIIHNLIFGYDGSLDFMTYRFFYILIFYFIAYFFTLKLFKNPFLTLLFLMCFPFVRNFYSYHLFYGILVFFIVRKLIGKQNIFNYFLLFSLLILTIVWRLDTGAASLFATTLFLPLYCYAGKKKIHFTPFLKSIGIILLIITGLVILISILKSPEYLLANFRSALHYTAANQAHGYTKITNFYSHQFYLNIIIYPAIAVLSILYIVFTLRNNVHEKFSRFTLNASLFLYLIFIMNFQRGLVRHGFMEHKDAFLLSTFFIATALFLFSFLKIKTSSWRYITFFSLSFFLFISLKYIPIHRGKTAFEKYLTKNTLFQLDKHLSPNSEEKQFKNLKGKTIKDKNFADKHYTSFKQFLDQNLSPEQTFLDFSNTPMLYYYCQRKVPAYFCQNLQNTIDDYLQVEHLKNITPEKVPVVVYSYYPPKWWDASDDVPNAMRHAIIAEYIYQNYNPLGIINGRSIWIAKGKSIQWEVQEIDTLIQEAKIYNYKNAAAIIYKHYNYKNDINLTLEGKHSINRKQENFIFEIDPRIKNTSTVFTQFILTERNKKIKVEIFGEKGLIGVILFISIENEKTYMIPLSNHYLWHVDVPKYLKVQVSNL